MPTTADTSTEMDIDYSNGSMTVTDGMMEAFFAVRLGNSPKRRRTHQYYQLAYTREQDKHSQGLRLVFQPPSDLTPISDRIYSLPVQKYKLKELPTKPSHRILRIVVISDTHDRHGVLETLPECDFLFHSGDILMTSRKFTPQYAYYKYQQFATWFAAQPARHKIVIGGNHDKILEMLTKDQLQALFGDSIHYLCNEVITLDGITTFGTPASVGESHNQAFQSNEFNAATKHLVQQYLEAQYAGQVPPIDILVSHGPDRSLRNTVRPQLFHISGHSHHYHGTYVCETRTGENLLNVAAPIMDASYCPVKLPIVIDCLLQH